MERLHHADRNRHPTHVAVADPISFRRCRGWRIPRLGESLLQLAAGPRTRHGQRHSLLWCTAGWRLGLPPVSMACIYLRLAHGILFPWSPWPDMGAELD